MLNLTEKITHLEKYLIEINDNYADSFKEDISIYFGDFKLENPNLDFLKKLNSKEDIENWIDKLTSRIVLKFDEQNEQLSDFISDYIELT